MLFQERKQIAIFVAAGVMVAAFVLFRYLPLQKRIRAVEQTKIAQTLVITKASMERAQMSAIKEQLLKLKRTVGNYKAIIPVKNDFGVFLQQITDLMSKHNLREQIIAPGEEVAVKGLNCIPVDMQCKGRLAQVFEFYKRMQRLDRLIRIEQVKLANDSDFSGEVSMQAKVVIYYRPKSRQG
ncbi:MAG: type IV pilus inner membrane component PilO [Planctomycetota bacterium]|jgi:Tfp pilus assembly protein PilO